MEFSTVESPGFASIVAVGELGCGRSRRRA
jgi:hypothetical protein